MINTNRLDEFAAVTDGTHLGNPEQFEGIRNPFDLEQFDAQGRRAAGVAIAAFVALPVVGGVMANIEMPSSTRAVNSAGTTPGSGSVPGTTPGTAPGTTVDTAPGTSSTPTTQTQGENMNDGQEQDYGIAGAGSCSPFTRADGERAARGEFLPGEDTTTDIEDVEVKFLEQNREFAKNAALTSESKIGSIYDVLNIQRPSMSEHPDQSLIDLFANERYTTVQLQKDLLVDNTYCDDQGNVHFYRRVVLEKGTFAGGTQLKTYEVKADGTRVATTFDGREVVLQKNTIVETIDVNGEQVPFLVTNKAGIDTDGDGKAERGCMNFLDLAPPEENQPPKKTTTTPVTTPPTTPRITTSTSTPSTTIVTTTTSTPPTTVTPKSAVPPVTGGPSTTVEKPNPGPSVPTTKVTVTTSTIPSTTTTRAGNSTTTISAHGSIPGTNRPGGSNR